MMTIIKLFSLIIKLHTAAMNLQDIERYLTERYYITFNSEQYELIYF